MKLAIVSLLAFVLAISSLQCSLFTEERADLVWEFATGDKVFSSPAVSGGYVYVGSCDNKVYCLDASTGSKVWEFVTGDEVRSSPAVSGGYVYVGSWDKKVYCLDADTGAKIW